MNIPHYQAAQSRREFLLKAGGGFGSLALASLLARNGLAGGTATTNLATRPLPHFAPKAKSVIWCFLDGGPSHIDLFDPKPALNKLAGKPLPDSFVRPVTAMGRTAYSACWPANARSGSTASPARGSATGIRKSPPASTTSRSSAAARPTA